MIEVFSSFEMGQTYAILGQTCAVTSKAYQYLFWQFTVTYCMSFVIRRILEVIFVVVRRIYELFVVSKVDKFSSCFKVGGYEKDLPTKCTFIVLKDFITKFYFWKKQIIYDDIYLNKDNI